MTIEVLKQELMALVPPYNDFPNDTGYTNALNSGVNAFNSHCARTKNFTVPVITSGTYTAAMSSFDPTIVNVRLIKELVSAEYDGVVIKGMDLFPMVSATRNQKAAPWIGQYIYDKVTTELSVTDIPENITSLTVLVELGIPDGFDVTTLHQSVKEIVLQFAIATVLGYQAQETAKDAFSFIVGSQTMDKRVQSERLAKRAAEALDLFERMVDKYKGWITRS